MKPCGKNRKLIGWLALDALDAREAQELQSHFKCCPGCSWYWHEMRIVAQNHLTVSATPLLLDGSDAFHEKLDSRIRGGQQQSFETDGLDLLRRAIRHWRVAAAAAGAVIFISIMAFRDRNHEAIVPRQKPLNPPTVATDDLEPTLSRYWTAANASPEALNKLLDEQEARRWFPTEIVRNSAINRE